MSILTGEDGRRRKGVTWPTRNHAADEDIDIARNVLRSDGVGLVAVKDGRLIVTSYERGVRSLVCAVLHHEEDLKDAVVGDRVVGRASAMLYICCRPAAVYTPLASERAVAELESAHIPVFAETTTSSILNRDGTGLCPFEKMTADLRSPAEVLETLCSFFGFER